MPGMGLKESMLPVKLRNEPLLEAICEVRVISSLPLHSVLPGVLFKELGGVSTVESLPFSAIPEAVRAADPALAYQPLVKVKFGSFTILLGQRHFAVSTDLPYPGWQEFRAAIDEVFRAILVGTSFISAIERYSIKYVNLIASPDLGTQHESLAINIGIERRTLGAQPFFFRSELRENDFLHILETSAGASVKIVGQAEPRFGALLVVDTLCTTSNISPHDFIDGLTGRLDEIRESNKRLFFDCITPIALARMLPQFTEVDNASVH